MNSPMPTAKLLTHSAARAEVKRLAQLTNEERSADFRQTLRVAVAGNVNTDFLSPGLQAGLASHAVDSEISALPYDSWIPSALAGNVDVGLDNLGVGDGRKQRPNGKTGRGCGGNRRCREHGEPFGARLCRQPRADLCRGDGLYRLAHVGIHLRLA